MNQNTTQENTTFDGLSKTERERRTPPDDFPPLINGVEIGKNPLPLPQPILHGLLSRGEKIEIAGGSKSFKTFALIDQSVSCAAGLDWWGFKAETNPSIYLNLEIPRPFFEQRVRDVARARGIAVPSNFNVWHLRGQRLYEPQRWIAFLRKLKEGTLDLFNPLITTDPIYKLLGGKNENAAGDVQTLLEQLEEMVQQVDGANSFGHHYTKGNQSQKDAIDRGSGSGVFQRDPDTLFPMTRHEKENAFVIEPTVRNHPPIKPFVVEWTYPIFTRNPDLDPEDLKTPKNSASGNNSIDLDKALAQVPLIDPELKTNVIEKIAKACHVGGQRARSILVQLIIDGKVFDVRIPNPNGGRGFAGVAKTATNI